METQCMDASTPNTNITEEQIYRMIEKVRYETNLPHKLACHAVYVVLENFSSLAPSVTPTIREVLTQVETPLQAPVSLIDNTQDMARLFVVTEDLDAVKNDAQQRSWGLFDDHGTIVEYLNELNCILTDADNAISKRFLHVTEYHIVSCLAEYYQMESRWTIKYILLETFDQLCMLSRTAAVVLLGSILPLELTRDIRNDVKDTTKLIPTLKVLTKIFSVGERIPVIYFETIGKEFISELLQLIETPSDNSTQEEILIQLVNFILVYNLQFDNSGSISDNVTIQALSESDNPKIFSETLLLLFNRGKDPVKCVNYESYPVNSLLKMITDIFLSDATSNLFYKNDVKVLIDITLRTLIDSSPCDNERKQWLRLIKQILQRIDVTEYADKISEIETCVLRFANEEENSAIPEDKELIDEIKHSLSQNLSSMKI